MEKDDKKPEHVPLNGFDWDGYVARYSGHTRVTRLVFIAERVREVREEALKQALDLLKQTQSTSQYSRVVSMAGGKSDDKWIEQTDRKSAQQMEKLELELNNYKTNLIKESIRMGHNDLGDFHYARGDLNAALKCYVRTRDYCTTSKHILTLCLNVIRVAIELHNFNHVANYVAKAEQTPDLTDEVVVAQLKAASGLAHLEQRKYKQAARKFLDCKFVLDQWTDVLSANDVALYGGLCALATFDRTELKKKVIDNAVFKQYLELEPHVRELINDFYTSNYSGCLGKLNQLSTRLKVDIHLHDHMNDLYTRIRNKALVQYFSPFLTVDLHVMAKAFDTSVDKLETEITKLIMDNMIEARVDAHKKVLHARQTDQRSSSFHKTLSMGKEADRATNNMLLRMNLLRRNFIVEREHAPDAKLMDMQTK